MVEKGPELAGLLFGRWVSETADPRFWRRIGAFFSALEIPFPGNGDRGRQKWKARRDELGREGTLQHEGLNTFGPGPLQLHRANAEVFC